MPKSKMQVVVFHMNGCSACKDYVPRFKRIAVKYRAFLNIQVANVSTDAKANKLADELKIEGVPATVVFDANDKVIEKHEGTISDAQIEKLLKKHAA